MKNLATICVYMKKREELISTAIKRGMRGEKLQEYINAICEKYPISDEEAQIWAKHSNWYEEKFSWAKGKRL